MSEMREQLLDRMIKIYGFEHEVAISFAHVCETYPTGDVYDGMLELLVECHEKNPVRAEEEDEE